MLPAGLLVLAFGEYKEWGAAFGGLTVAGAVYVTLSCVVGVAISYAGFRLQRRISATTFLVTTNTNKMAVLGFGAFALKDQCAPPAPRPPRDSDPGELFLWLGAKKCLRPLIPVW